MLDKIVGENESGIDSLLEDSDTKYVAEEPVPKTKEDCSNILTPEANIDIKDTTSCCNTGPPKKKLKQKIESLNWKSINPKKCELQAKIMLDLLENPGLLFIFESATGLNELVSLICE